MNVIETNDINNKKCLFQYIVEYGDELHPNEITFKVYSIPVDELKWFTYRLKIIDDTFAKSELLDNNGNEAFKRKGIPEKIIEIASKTLQRNISSSPITFNPGNYLVPSAKKAWERLLKQNTKVKFNKTYDCFILEWN